MHVAPRPKRDDIELEDDELDDEEEDGYDDEQPLFDPDEAGR